VNRRLFHLFLFMVIVAAFGCREESTLASRGGRDAFNIIIITLDTTRADRLGCYGCAGAQTPHLDRLASEGVRFSRAYSPVPLTLPAHCSLFTGRYPLFHRVRNNGNRFLPQEAETLAEILRRKGYTTAAFIASFVLDSRFGLDQGFDVYEDDMENGGRIKTLASERRADEVFGSFSSWFADRPAGPFFVWVHFFDPHLPYDPPEPFRSNTTLSSYDGEIANVDLSIGRIIAQLSVQNILDRTLIVAAGDHGEAFGEHGEIGHGVFCYGEAVNIPLILRAPGRIPSGLVCKSPVSLVDIAPTVLDFLNLPIPSSIQGSPLQRVLKKSARSDRSLFIESVFLNESLSSAPVRGIIQREFKFLDLPRPELYDLTADPGETVNLFLKQASITRAMRQTLEGFEKAAGASNFSEQRTMSIEEKERLESLGYISSPQSASKPESGLPDPKDVVHAWTIYQSGEIDLKSGQIAAAEEKFRAAVKENQQLINAFSHLAEIYFQRGDLGALEQILEQGIAANPGNGTLYLRRLFYLFQLGRIDAVLQGLVKAEAIVPYWQQEQLYNLAGTACGRAGLYDQAASYFGKVLAIEPANAEAAKNLGYVLFMQGRYPEALTYQRQAEKRLAQDPQLAAETAMTLAKQKDYAAAGRYFEKALQLRTDEGVLFQYAEMLAEHRDYARAISLLKPYANLPTSSRSFREKARRLIRVWQGQYH